MYLDLARGAERWLDEQAVETEDGRFWRSSDETDDHPVTTGNLYYGSSGIILFYLELHQQTGDPGFLEVARSAGNHLVATIPGRLYIEKELNALELYPSLNQPADSPFPVYSAANGRGHPNQMSLYWGVAGIGFVLGELHRVTGDEVYLRAARRVVDLLVRDHHAEESGTTWGSTAELMTGDAGAGLFLLYAASELGHSRAESLARSVGDSLLARATPVGGGLTWSTMSTYGTDYPNFSHGSAGVGYFLAKLYERTGHEPYRAGAVAVGSYVAGLADEQGLVPHHLPDESGLVYYGWCHGPPGTNRLFERLEGLDSAGSWASLVERSVEALRAADLLARKRPGFWDNVGQCCGSAGIADYFLRRYRRTGRAEDLDFAREMSADILEHAIAEGEALYWPQPEHRTSPDFKPIQTGYMQGAAGMGMHFLRMHAAVNDLPLSVRMLDDRDTDTDTDTVTVR